MGGIPDRVKELEAQGMSPEEIQELTGIKFDETYLQNYEKKKQMKEAERVSRLTEGFNAIQRMQNQSGTNTKYATKLGQAGNVV